MAVYPSKGLPEGSGLGLGIATMTLRPWNSVQKLEADIAMLGFTWGSARTAKESTYPKKLDKSSDYEDWKRQWEKKMSGYDDWKRRWEARLNKKPAS